MKHKYDHLSISDFYFFVGTASKQDQKINGIHSIIIICPKEYFDTNKYCYDGHLRRANALKQLPKYMSEDNEGQFSSTKSVEETHNDLIHLGLQQSREFSDFCAHHDPFCYAEEMEPEVY